MHVHDAPVYDGLDGDEQKKALALLAYLVDHNKSHADELRDLAHHATGPASDLIEEAVALMDQGNDKLALALAALKEG